MYAFRGTAPETPAENTGDDDVIIVRRGNRNSARPAQGGRPAPAERQQPRGESLTARILKAPGRALGRFAGNIARHPIQSVSTFLGATTLLSIGHHTGFNQMLVGSFTSPGAFRDVLNTPGRLSHQMWGTIGGRVGENLPGVITGPAQVFLKATRDIMGPPTGR